MIRSILFPVSKTENIYSMNGEKNNGIRHFSGLSYAHNLQVVFIMKLISLIGELPKPSIRTDTFHV